MKKRDKQNQLTFLPRELVMQYLLICHGGSSTFWNKDIAIATAKSKEDKGLRVRLYESVCTDNDGFETMKCIYYTNCPKKLIMK